jgi:predicted small lipoprotein YifL
MKNRIYSLIAVAAVLTLAACPGRDDARTVEQDTLFTTIPTQDTVAVEREVEVRHDTVIDTRP